jgi:hypothetical protein
LKNVDKVAELTAVINGETAVGFSADAGGPPSPPPSHNTIKFRMQPTPAVLPSFLYFPLPSSSFCTFLPFVRPLEDKADEQGENEDGSDEGFSECK